MVLLVAVLAGLLSGLVRARLGKKSYRPVPLRLTWLVLAAFAVQWMLFSFPITRINLPEPIVRISFVLSQFALLAFAWVNRKTSGFWLLGIGLLLNLIVITANKGFMPITPETVQWLRPDAPTGSWQIGRRLGYGKDIVLPQSDTFLWFLSDRFRSFSIQAYRVAFSLGDIFIALGAFWLFWSMGGQVQNQIQQETHHEPDKYSPLQ